MQSISPVYSEAEVPMEKTLALDQPQFKPVISLPVSIEIINPKTFQRKLLPNWGVALRFEFSDEDRAAIAAGGSLVLTEIVFGKQMTPINLQICMPGEKPVFQMAEHDMQQGEPN